MAGNDNIIYICFVDLIKIMACNDNLIYMLCGYNKN